MSPTKQSSPSLSRREAAVAVLSAATVGAVVSIGVAHAQSVQLVAVDVVAVGQGYQISKLIGRSVQNDKAEKIGTVDDFIVTRERSLIAVLQVGGFLGLGGHLIAVPYDSLNIGDDGQKITLAGGSKEALQKLPEFKFKK